jgi:hypothetical protein
MAADDPRSTAPRCPWFDHTTDVKPRLDRFRDPLHWMIDRLPWFLRRFYIAAQYREWPPNGARFIVTRRPPWEAFDFGRKLHREAESRDRA